MFRSILFSAFLLFSLSAASQTIVMNEVSNGPSGNMEYVEFVVVDTTTSYNCSGVTNPPCLDLRGWIFDDNSGYHGSAGVAAGCIRFSNNSFWSCIPIGTILLIYNDQDPNTSLPPIDTSLTDGNCRIVVPVNKENWFDRNVTTPGAIACSYPLTGWVAAGSWSTTLLANGGDCARIVNLAGCEVFSVCWGTANLSPLIYFNGSAQDRVYFFNNNLNNDPTNILNWTNGCADPGACSLNQQTPGAPNNPANAAWINSMNNGCSPVQPMSVTSNTIAGSCPCSASATVNTTGSLPPFSYTWNPSPTSGQGTSVASGLCSGTYTCIVKSNTTKCTETITVNVTNSNTLVINASNTGTYCEGNTIQLNSDAADSYTWSGPGNYSSNSPNPIIAGATPSMSGSYTIQASVGNCTATNTTSLTVFPSPVTTISTNSIACEGSSLTFSAGPGLTYNWSGPNGFTSNQQNNTLSNINNTNSGTYTLVVTDNIVCSNTFTINLSVNPLPNVSATSQPACETGTLQLNAMGAISYTWSGPNSFTSTLSNPFITNVTALNAGIYTVTAQDNSGCENTSTLSVVLTTPQTTSIFGDDFCSGSTLNLSATGGTNFIWSGPASFNSNSQTITINEADILNAGVYSVSISDGVCPTVTQTIEINILPKPALTISSSNNNPCNDSTVILSASGAASYVWSGPSGLSSSSSDLIIKPITKDNDGLYSVIGTGTNGCKDSSDVQITVRECLCESFIPEGFSPNGDGVHDFFEITCIEGKTVSIEIYNRWGNVVFKNNNYKNDWNGKANAGIGVSTDDLPEGTYFYIIYFNNDTDKKTGFITLLR